ncbi:hypothetical protein RIF29_37949 [Crotalaria pallida]|uniref:Uncharacterized protein n=1 Tax=Crotalaria pallida TaxID=3830 RepID=A0AAN9E088_CROPI
MEQDPFHHHRQNQANNPQNSSTGFTTTTTINDSNGRRVEVVGALTRMVGVRGYGVGGLRGGTMDWRLWRVGVAVRKVAGCVWVLLELSGVAVFGAIAEGWVIAEGVAKKIREEETLGFGEKKKKKSSCLNEHMVDALIKEDPSEGSSPLECSDADEWEHDSAKVPATASNDEGHLFSSVSIMFCCDAVFYSGRL